MIERLELKNFTAFTDLSVEFSPGINVFIGENGTGKTHLLKAAYGLCYKYDNGRIEKEDAAKHRLKEHWENVFEALFLPLNNRLGELRTQGVSGNARLALKLTSGLGRMATIEAHPKAGAPLGTSRSAVHNEPQRPPVFIPPKEVLSFMTGFVSLYEKYAITFDQTYQDICLSLDFPVLRPEALPKESKWAMDKIEALCGGRFIFEGGGNVKFKAGDVVYSANAVAEGFRKIGMLSRLLENGSIEPGVSGPLFWDEPEANLNPRIMELLVQILLELSRHGQQIILATHDYVLLKWFDLLMKKGDQVRFHSLYRDPEGSNVKIFSTDRYDEIAPNPLDDAYDDLIGQQITNDMGGLGK